MATAPQEKTGAAQIHALAGADPLFARAHAEARDAAERDPNMASFLYAAVLSHDSLESVVAYRLAQRLEAPDMPGAVLARLLLDAMARDQGFGEALRADLVAVFDRDPACARILEPTLYFKGFHAIETHRLAHGLWRSGRSDLALWLQSASSARFQTDIHPQARIGKGFFLDHATGVVIGSTSVIEDEVSMLHGVTLGGTGTAAGARHPKVRRGVLIGAGAKILGDIEIGECARIAAGSVVMESVPAHKTVAGVPARIIGDVGAAEPSLTMDQLLDEPAHDPGL
ncbi:MULTISPECIES: serine O-acetyltransferase [Methylosinus]|uniref:Serine acetyltransferase n=1 Tax=Methylosinus trichosporium (strain ATCC 35070 / NCIMB 11131 / UNIQEM 75 / OB3b) TaxID=595536 RepID=A0A2D2D0W5_METT3|nr:MULTISPECIES: serine O-acetyltransferase [Methylosinus]ATQ68594.1 serine O-acetyltransferase [Methylosinus trichosporium OB3b]OBS51020.1 serine O-acetyltransferase [Methylosinus sp. 3S-1]